MSYPPPPVPERPARGVHGRVAIVTGAGTAGDGIGNGRATALLLAEDGALVVCVDINGKDAERTAELIEEEGKGMAFAYAADVSDEEQCKGVVEATMAEFGRVDILVNIVGIMGARGTAVEVDMVEWTKSMEINVSSMVMMAKYAIPQMKRNYGHCRGAIVNMGSSAGLRGGTPHLFYPTSKGAVVNLTRAMADNHGKDGIRVNCVCPGLPYTPMVYSGGMSEETRAARTGVSMLKTEGNAFDVAACIRFLASDEARWVTGAVVPVDAGATTTINIPLGDGLRK